MKHTSARSVRRAAAALACAAILLPLTACDGDEAADDPAGGGKASQSPAGADAKPNGVEKLSAADIYNKGKKTNADAGSVHERQTRSDAKTDLRVSATDCVGTVDLLDHGKFEIIRKGDDIWGKVDSRFTNWAKQNGSTVPADKWMHGSESNDIMKALSSYCHTSQFTKPDTASVKMTKGAATELEGQPVIPIVIENQGKKGTYDVATTGKPYMVMQEGPYKGGSARIVWTEFGTPVNAKAPTGEIVEAPKG
ncbi:hypothetical protein ACQUSR_20385 [Streptomyces sp. P1-3]|uniref:hypothetical protein n=1 Tax=Streptomyces sp. P1-3 TaxID=3421658 RepID=UPI003D367EB8